MIIGYDVAIGGQHDAAAGALRHILPEEIAGRNAFGGDGNNTILHPLYHIGITDADTGDNGTIGGGDLYPLIQNGGAGAQQAALCGDDGTAGAAHHGEHKAACQQQSGTLFLPSCGFFVCVRRCIPRSSRLLRLLGRGILIDAVFIITILPVGKLGIAGGEVAVVKIIILICHRADLPFCGTGSLSLSLIHSISSKYEQCLTCFFKVGKNDVTIW